MSVENWAEIRRLHRAEELPIKLIARTLGVSRDTVRAALPAEGPPRYVRAPAGRRSTCSSRGSVSSCRRFRRCRPR